MTIDQFSWWFDGFLQGCNGRNFTDEDQQLIRNMAAQTPFMDIEKLYKVLMPVMYNPEYSTVQ